MHVNSAGLHRVEHGIRPPMGKAITLTVGRGVGLAVYVATPAFGCPQPDDSELIRIASAIATFLERFDEPLTPPAPRVMRRTPSARRPATGWTVIGSVFSDSEPDVEHKITRRAVGALGCDCMAYRFKKGEKTCKHIQAYVESEQAVRHIARTSTVVAAAPVRHTTGGETFTVRRGISFGPLTAGG